MRVTLLLAALALAACHGDFVDDLAVDRPAPGSCRVDADCVAARSELCRQADGSGAPSVSTANAPATGMCVVPARAGAGEVYLEVRPTTRSLPMIPFGPERLTVQDQNSEFIAPAPVTIEGVVSYAGTVGAPVGIPGVKVRLQRPSSLPGRPRQVFEATTNPVGSGRSGGFRMVVPQGRYSFLVLPPTNASGITPPPASFEVDTALPPDTTDGLRVFAIPRPAELVAVQGHARYLRDGAIVDASGLSVWAIDATSLPAGVRSLDRDTASPLTQPVAIESDGTFRIWLPPATNAEPRKLRLLFGPAAGASPFPTVLAPEVSLGTGASLDTMLGVVEAPVTVQGRVLARVVDGGFDGVPGAAVTFRTKAGASFSYSVTVVTDETGRYEASLFPESYEAVTVVPPGSLLAHAICKTSSAQTPVSVDAAAELDFECASRSVLFGHAVDASLVGVPEVEAEVVRRPDALVDHEIRQHVKTDELGWFKVALSVGVYDVVLTAPKARKLATTRTRVDILDERPLSVVMGMSEPYELFGSLFLGDRQHPIAASLEAYAIETDAVEGESLAVLVGTGVSDAAGRFSLVLPVEASARRK